MKTEKPILLTDVNEFITCVICKGYLIDATTITECLHTFCKKCIVEYLEDSNHCPRCDIELHHSYPLQQISHDRTLQSIVYKLVANLEKNEIQRQIDFYKEKNLEFPAQLKEKIEQSNLFSEFSSAKANTTNEPPKENGSTDYHRTEEPMSLILEPMEGLESLNHKYVICSCNTTITTVKKYIASKLYSNKDLYKEIDIVFNDEIVSGKDHTLKFVLFTSGNIQQPMMLYFRPKVTF